MSLGIRKENGCLEWHRATAGRGYGIINRNGRNYYVHRYVAFLVGIITRLDSPFDVLHTCDNPPCFEPTHLKAGTDSINLREAWKRGLRKKKGI